MPIRPLNTSHRPRGPPHLSWGHFWEVPDSTYILLFLGVILISIRSQHDQRYLRNSDFQFPGEVKPDSHRTLLVADVNCCRVGTKCRSRL